MKTKLLAALFAALALGLVGAASNPGPVVAVGSSYLISNGAAAVQGEVTAELGNGWVTVKRTDGRETKVNLANAFFVEGAR